MFSKDILYCDKHYSWSMSKFLVFMKEFVRNTVTVYHFCKNVWVDILLSHEATGEDLPTAGMWRNLKCRSCENGNIAVNCIQEL